MPTLKPGANARTIRTARRSGAIQPPSDEVPMRAAATVEARHPPEWYQRPYRKPISCAPSHIRSPANDSRDQKPLPPLHQRDPNNMSGELDYSLVFWTASDEAAYTPQTRLARLPVDVLVIAMRAADQATQDQVALVEPRLRAAVTQARVTPDMYRFVRSLAACLTPSLD